MHRRRIREARIAERRGWQSGTLHACARALVIALICVSGASEVWAAGAISLQTWDSGLDEAHVMLPGQSATRTGAAASPSSMANNPALHGSAWAHTGSWWNLHVGDLAGLRITIEAQTPGSIAPGVSVWAIGDSGPFDGGTTAWAAETSTAGFGTPHSFNAYQALGSAGTLWMQEGQGGNAKESLGYAVSGPSMLSAGGWGETILQGAHDMRVSSAYASSVKGRVGPGLVELELADVSQGWLLIYAGGTDHSLSGGLFDLEVSAVPEPTTAVLMGLGLVSLAIRRPSNR